MEQGSRGTPFPTSCCVVILGLLVLSPSCGRDGRAIRFWEPKREKHCVALAEGRENGIEANGLTY